MFVAKLKLSSKVSHHMRVDEVISSLNLESCKNTIIGGPMLKGISGGQHKRVSIGIELISKPNLIVLDEPTTGLDSMTANTVTSCLKDLARSGWTIIASIHQPSSDLYMMFDQLMLLAQGRVIFMNDASKAVKYFDSIGYICPPNTNPAEHFMNM